MSNEPMTEPLLVHEPGADSVHLRLLRTSLDKLSEAELVVLAVLIRQRQAELRGRRAVEER
jgi:hypothetical protein